MMNERIRELREQAWALIGDEQRARGELYEAQEQWERCDQKFAELIVRECIDTAFHKGHPDLEFLLKHFGVEE